MKAFGKLLQKIGLIILPVAMVLEVCKLLGRDTLSHMLLMFIFGVCIFFVGRIIEGYARS